MEAFILWSRIDWTAFKHECSISVAFPNTRPWDEGGLSWVVWSCCYPELIDLGRVRCWWEDGLTFIEDPKTRTVWASWVLWDLLYQIFCRTCGNRGMGGKACLITERHHPWSHRPGLAWSNKGWTSYSFRMQMVPSIVFSIVWRSHSGQDCVSPIHGLWRSTYWDYLLRNSVCLVGM